MAENNPYSLDDIRKAIADAKANNAPAEDISVLQDELNYLESEGADAPIATQAAPQIEPVYSTQSMAPVTQFKPPPQQAQESAAQEPMTPERYKSEASQLIKYIEEAKQAGAPRDVVDTFQKELDFIGAEFKSTQKSYLRQMLESGGVPSQMASQGAAEFKKGIDKSAAAKKAELNKTKAGEAANILAESAGLPEVLARGAMAGTDVLKRGIGAYVPNQTPIQEAYQQALAAENPIAYNVAKSATEGFPFIAGSLALGPAVGAALPTASLTGPSSALLNIIGQGALGGVEGAIVGGGQGEKSDAATPAAVGALMSAGMEAVPYLGRAYQTMKGIIPDSVFTPNGNFSPAIEKWASTRGINLDATVAAAERDPSAIAELLGQASREGGFFSPDPEAAQRGIAGMSGINADLRSTYINAGIPPELIPLAAISDRAQVRDLMAALIAVPGSSSREAAGDFSKALRNFTRDAINNTGGDTASMFSNRALSAMDGKIAAIKAQEAPLWGQIDAELDNTFVANPKVNELVSKLKQERKKYSTTPMPSVQQEVLEALIGKNGRKTPKLADINKTLSQIGEQVGLGRERSLYTDSSRKLMGEMYDALREIKKTHAEQKFSGGYDAVSRANALTVARKNLEEHAQFFREKDGFGSMVADLAETGAKLSKDDYEKFDRVFDNILPEHKKGAMATILSQTLNIAEEGTSNTLTGAQAPAFIKLMGSINRSPELKGRVKGALGEEAFNAFDSLGKMWGGMVRADSGLKTGANRDAITLFASKSGIMSRILGGFISRSGVGQAAGADIAGKFVEAPEAFQTAVSRMVSSPSFQRAITDVLADPDAARRSGQNAIFMRTKIARDYLNEVTPSVRARIFRAGGIPAWVALNEEAQQ